MSNGIDGIAIRYRSKRGLVGPILMWDRQRQDYLLDNGLPPMQQALEHDRRQGHDRLIVTAERMPVPNFR